MSQENDVTVCEACGTNAEIGYIIAEGDDVAQVTITAADKETAMAEFDQYLNLAKQVNENVAHDMNACSFVPGEAMTVNLKFECSAEKVIFELRSRSLSR